MALNQLKYDQLETGSVYPITASYAISSSVGSGGTSLITGSTYSITSSWSNNSISSSYSLNSSTASYLDPISQSLIPSTGSTYSLGSPTNKWKDLYVSTGSIYIGDTVLSTSGSTLYANTSPVVTLNTSSGQIEIIGITASLSASYTTNAGLLNNTSSTIFATTGSNNFNGNQTVQGNITIVGSLIAQQYIVSSSVSYFTSSNFDGSTKFGDTDSDTHQFTGSLRSPNITGSLLGTSSFSNNSISASYSLTSSVALTALTSSYINIATNAVSSSYAGTASVSTSSSFATTSSYNINSISSSYSLTASFAANAGSSLITGSTYPITSSWSNNSISSSYSTFADSATSATSATSANTATSASYATNAGSSTSATTANTANSATSASYSLSSSYSINSNTAISSSFASTASYVVNSISSSYALTASHALNASGGGTTLTTGSTYPITSSWANNAITASFAMNGGSGGSGGTVQTGSIANQTVLYNVTTSQDNIISGLNLSSNKWDVSVIEEWNSGSGDIFYPSCSLLMHFSGSNGSTTFIDNSPSPKTATRAGNVQISTVQSKFGGASGLFDGTGDNLSFSTNSQFAFGTGDFTIEMWIYPQSAVGYQCVMLIGTAAPYIFIGINAGSTGTPFMWNDGNVIVGSQNFTINAWQHWSVVRNSGTVTMYLNGTNIGSASFAGSLTDVTGTYIGTNSAGSQGFVGYIDELRITKGVARYTSSFTTQSVEFPNQSPQFETKYVGLVGGLNDSTVDYGVEKLSDSSLKIRKMSATGQPLSGSGQLSASVDRVYVNVLDYTNVMVTSSYALTASYVLGGIQTGSISNQTILYNVTTSQENTITGLDLSGNKWDVSVIEEWDTNIIPGDQYYSSCSLILHFNGANGDTTFVDNSPNVFGITGSNGVAISTAQSKFGGSSVNFDGTNDYITIAAGQKGNLSSGDFTIEFWLYTTSATGTFSFIQQGEHDWRFAGGNTSVDIVLAGVTRISGATFSANTWNHLALVKNGSTTTLYINGTSSGTTTSSPANSTNNIYLGVNAASVGNVWYYNGYMDEVRITKGIARYTGSFTPPSSEFYNNVSVTQLETKYIGSTGGLNDTNVDYGIQKLNNSSLKIRKMSATGTPVSGSVALSSSVDRVYVNVLNYKEVQTTAQSASYATTSSYSLSGGTTSGKSIALSFILG